MSSSARKQKKTEPSPAEGGSWQSVRSGQQFQDPKTLFTADPHAQKVQAQRQSSAKGAAVILEFNRCTQHPGLTASRCHQSMIGAM